MSYIVEVSRSFRAMNTGVSGVVSVQQAHGCEATRALEGVECRFREAEAILSRFNPDSELSRLNAAAGHPFEASSILFEVVSAAVHAARVSHGIFDPTILDRLIAAGYDCSFEMLGFGSPSVENSPCSPHDWRDISLDATASLICIPAGCSLDLGGIGKGWAVDRAAEDLRRFPGFALDAGGDIALQGSQADGSPWTVGISNPFAESENLMILGMTSGAVCTSSTLHRAWGPTEGKRHHIIDPRTGRPARSGVVAATVTAPSAAEAETVAKAAIILGEDAGIAFIKRQRGTEGLLVLEDGRLAASSGFKDGCYVA